MRRLRTTFLRFHRTRGWFPQVVRVCLLLLVVTPSQSLAQRGAMTVGRGLDQLTAEANLIVHGAVRSAKVEPHPQFSNLMTVVVTFDVQETLKGEAHKTVQFRQYIWDIRDQMDAAQYRKGQELLLLLGPVSTYGLTSPVGLEQGRFTIVRDGAGRATAVNGRGNLGLFQHAEARAKAQGVRLSPNQVTMMRQAQSGAVDLADLKSAIRTFAGAK